MSIFRAEHVLVGRIFMTDILIVDGNAGLATMLATALRLEGFSAATAPTCHAALRAMNSEASRPRMLLVDCEALLLAEAVDLEQWQQCGGHIAVVIMTTNWH